MKLFEILMIKNDDASLLFNRGIVNGRKSAWNFETVDDGGLGGRIKLGVNKDLGMGNDVSGTFVVEDFRDFDFFLDFS